MKFLLTVWVAMVAAYISKALYCSDHFFASGVIDGLSIVFVYRLGGMK